MEEELCLQADLAGHTAQTDMQQGDGGIGPRWWHSGRWAGQQWAPTLQAREAQGALCLPRLSTNTTQGTPGEASSTPLLGPLSPGWSL